MKYLQYILQGCVCVYVGRQVFLSAPLPRCWKNSAMTLYIIIFQRSRCSFTNFEIYKTVLIKLYFL